MKLILFGMAVGLLIGIGAAFIVKKVIRKK
jgi:hypothetical protein